MQPIPLRPCPDNCKTPPVLQSKCGVFFYECPECHLRPSAIDNEREAVATWNYAAAQRPHRLHRTVASGKKVEPAKTSRKQKAKR